MRTMRVAALAMVALVVLAGCGGKGGPSAAVSQGASAGSNNGGYTSAALDVSYPNALPAAMQLALGSLRLEGSDQAITPAQAKALLPLWQALQGTALRNQAEVNAVLRQIERTMTQSQLAAIAELRLTMDDLRAWMEAQGITPPAGPPADAAAGRSGNLTEEQRASLRATVEAGGQPPMGAGNPFGNLTDEQRASIRATVQAGGQPFGGEGNPFGNLTEEQRAALRATRAAGGDPAFGGAGRAGVGPLLGPLIRLLTERASQ